MIPKLSRESGLLADADAPLAKASMRCGRVLAVDPGAATIESEMPLEIGEEIIYPPVDGCAPLRYRVVRCLCTGPSRWIVELTLIGHVPFEASDVECIARERSS